MRDVLQVGIWCAITLISLLFGAVLWLGTSSLDLLGGLTHGGHCDPVHGLYEDCAPLQSLELLLSHPAIVGLGRGSGSFGWCGHLR
jgi:hypothetical protein